MGQSASTDDTSPPAPGNIQGDRTTGSSTGSRRSEGLSARSRDESLPLIQEAVDGEEPTSTGEPERRSSSRRLAPPTPNREQTAPVPKKEVVPAVACCLYCKCCPLFCARCRCVRHNIQRDIHVDHRFLVRVAFGVGIASFLFVLAANVASFAYVIAMIPSTFSQLHLDDFTHSKYDLDFGIAVGGMCLLPVVMFFFWYYPLYTAVEHNTKRKRRKESVHAQYGGNPSTPRPPEETILPIPIGRRSERNKTLSELVDSVEDDPQPLEIGHRRRLLLTLSLFGIFIEMIICLIAIAGASPWGGAGVLFMYNVHHTVANIYERSGLTTPLNDYYFKIIALPMASSVLFILQFGLLATLASYVVKVLKHPAGIAGAMLGAIGVLSLVILATNFAGPIVPPPPPTGKREFCFKNSCSQPIRVGQVGGSSGIHCSSGCPAGTICNPGNGLCHFSLTLPSSDLYMGPGGQFCVPFLDPPVNAQILVGGTTVYSLTQWSGSIYASTGCDGSGGCQTGLCKNCQPYVGPIGPVTQGEFTLLVNQQDYYDITIINGANLPMKITPRSPNNLFQPLPNVNPVYYCQSPGDPTPLTGAAATWQFQTPDTSHVLVPPNSGSVCGGGGQNQCADPSHVCGTAMALTALDLPTNDVDQNQCGPLLGIWSDDELCAWTAAVSYGNCKDVVPGRTSATYQDMFACIGGFAQSCFQDGATSECCGCSTWPSLGLTETMTCQSTSPAWEQYAKPSLHFLKAACPTCYTYPFDDSTSLFTCQSNSTDNVNRNSYTIEWCPGGVEITLG